MAKTSADDDRPALQTPTAGTSASGAGGGQLGKLEDVPVGRTSPRPTSSTLTPSNRPTSSTTIDSQKTAEIKSKLDKTTKTMEQNIEAATQRGESLNELQDKTQQVAESSKQFSKNARTVKKNLWWKNMRMTIIITLIILAVLGGIAGVIYVQSKG